MSEKDIYSVLDKIRREMEEKHPDWEEQTDTILSLTSYELRKLIK